MDDQLAIEAIGLRKAYGATPVLDGIDVRVGRGEVVSLRGPNGAGKTTTIRILATLLAADGGSACVAGFCAFVPVATMPGWLHGFAGHQPITPVVETLRGLLTGTPPSAAPWHALAWCGGILAVSTALAAATFARRTR